MKLYPSPHTQLTLVIGADLLIAIVDADAGLRAVYRRGPLAHDDRRDVEVGSTPSGVSAEWLREAIGEVRTELGISVNMSANIALLQPLVSVKFEPLPPTGSNRAKRLLETNASRFFPWNGLSVATVVPQHRIRGVDGSSVLIAGARHDDLETIASAVESGGLSIAGLFAAPIVLAQVLQKRRRKAAVSSRLSDSGIVYLVSVGSVLEAILIRRREILAVAVWPLSGADLAPPLELLRIAAGSGWDFEEVACISPPFSVERLAQELPHLRVHRPDLAGHPAEVADLDNRLESLALLDTGLKSRRSSSPELLPTQLFEARVARTRRQVGGMLVAAVALLLAVAPIRLWDLKRELVAVRHVRSTIADQAVEARKARDAVLAVTEINQDLEALERSRIEWTGAIAAIARDLPDAAHLDAVSGDSTGLRLSGMTTDTASTRQGLVSQADPEVVWAAIYDEARGVTTFESVKRLQGLVVGAAP
jgi:hypothetical protein